MTGLKNVIFLPIMFCVAVFAAPAHADLCTSVRDGITTAASKRDINFFQALFPDSTDRGNRRWNEIVVQCNRKRDGNGNEISKVTAVTGGNAGKNTLKARTLATKVIRGHYSFFGIAPFKYVYVLGKKGGEWTMTIPYLPIFNDIVKNRVDFNKAHASKLYDASEIVDPGSATPVLIPAARSIWVKQCAGSTYFPGKERKYANKGLHQRDKENKFISLGRIQYKYGKDKSTWEGCRVNARRDLFWRDPAKGDLVVRVKPQDWILDNFVRTAETYWSIKGLFRLKLFVKGWNDNKREFRGIRARLKNDDHLKVRFATMFLRAGFNQMYKANLWQPNNFSTMTTDGTYWHEVGHAFGLDDEYGGKDKNGVFKKDGCKYEEVGNDLDARRYQMCNAGTGSKRRIYHYLAVSRYITKQNECDTDRVCGAGKYCNKGIATVGRNQCLDLKADNASCAAVGGGHQCKSGKCRWGRCYTPNSVAMGGTCYLNAACKVGKCSAADGFRGRCECRKDTDCGAGKWCNAGIDLKPNACRAKLAKGRSCGKIGSLGNGHKCRSGKCSGFPNYKCK